MIQWLPTDEGLAPFVNGRRVARAPLPGSQVAFVTCPIFEALYEGPRGPGKTDGLLMSFGQHVGKGYGTAWRGILFRRTYPELRDIIDSSLTWFNKVWPNATYNHGEHYWHWPTGEMLFFRHFARPVDYWNYHGHEYPWQAWEEITTWPTLEGYLSMFACARSPYPNIPIQVRSTTNPWGVGHNLVKERFRLPVNGMVGRVIRDSRTDDGSLEPPRVAIHGRLEENLVLLHAQPNYIDLIRASAKSPAQAAAWVDGDWDIVAGGMLDDIWNPKVHVLPNFPFRLIPQRWRVFRSYDHGQTRPFSVGWWAMSNGEPFEFNGKVYGPVRGDLIRIAEWYGWTGKPNKGLDLTARTIAQGVRDRERDWQLRVAGGPADSKIFDKDPSGTKSVASDMAEVGIDWVPADKGPGSRNAGWSQLRGYLEAAATWPREYPGLFVLERCLQFRRTVPVLPRDERDPDDVDTESEDHIGDETRYALRHKDKQVRSGTWR